MSSDHSDDVLQEDDTNCNGDDDKKVHISTALNLVWSFGINKNIPVLNVSNSQRKALFYTTTHTGILYNFETNSQLLYQGHCNAITCTCVSEDKRWLVTADIGDNSMLIVWDTKTSVPIKTIFDADPTGIIAIAISNDAKYIAALNCSLPQTLSIWDWTTALELPVAKIQLDETLGLQTYICFSVTDTHQLVSNNTTQVIFYKWDKSGDVTFSAPALNDKDFNKTVGLYSQSVFQLDCLYALTATSGGNIVVWTMISSNSCERKSFKLVKLQDKAITILKLMNNLIVTGDIVGNVKFFDLELKLVNWYNKLGCIGPINSISFTYVPKLKDDEKSPCHLYPTSSTLEASPFIVNDFCVSTTKANYLYFQSEGSVVEFIRKESNKDIKAIACHPKGSYIAIGGFDGLLQVLDFETKVLVHSRQFTDKHIHITCLTYSHTGDYIAIGYEDGEVQIVDSVTLELEGSNETLSSFHYSHKSILKLVFSEDSRFLACSDMDRCVVVFRYNSSLWEYLGKHRAHYKQISDVMFTSALDENNSRLMSIGEDRMLVEYDLKNSSVDDLKVLSTDRIEQDAIPICLATYPPVAKEHFLVVSNDHFKLKLFNSTTKMCRQTLLGPTYGTPIQRILVLPEVPDSLNRYMAYVTVDKVGMIILPFDGNPYKSMALIAHPGKVDNLACSFDGHYIFTAGGADTSVLMWKVDLSALEATSALGGEDLTPFYSLLDGGRDGELFAELEDYFYYSQMRNQGIDSMQTRNVSAEIPLSEIPFIMRALGYYPTEQEIEEMINEVKFSEYVTTGQKLQTVGLGKLIKLYVNHRPAFGLDPSKLVSAFNKIGFVDTEDGVIKVDRSHLMRMLQEKGEHLTESELAEYMSVLLGDVNEDDDENTMPTSLEDILPEKISIGVFASDILGFSASDNVEP